MSQHIALIPAGGNGQRFGAPLPKQYASIAGEAMVVHTLRTMLAFEPFMQVWIVLAPADAHAARVLTELQRQHGDRLQLCFEAGNSRADTVSNGLKAMQTAGVASNTWVWVHDAARPGVAAVQLQALAAVLRDHPVGAVLATPVADTVKQAAQTLTTLASIVGSGAGTATQPSIACTVPRSALWHAQTPQCFRLGVLSQALDHSKAQGLMVTDEASAIEMLGLQPALVRGSSHNFKVTTPEDAQLMEAVLTINPVPEHTLSSIRIGEGMDVHALVAGRPLILGGVTIAHHTGLQGHSDADALLHAITDAVLGAAGMGDIGRMFPDTDAQHAGADSQKLLVKAYAAVQAAGWVVVNVDATIVAQAPKMAPHVPAMQANIAQCLKIKPTQVNVKAKTNERLGWLGREEGIETRAVVLLVARGTLETRD